MLIKSNHRGITLIELLISIAILGIIACYSSVFSPLLYKKNQMQAVKQEIKRAIQWARIQARMSGQTLILARRPGGDDWSLGMLLFVDNVKHQYTPESILIQEWDWPASELRLSWRGFQSQDYLRFTPTMNDSAINGSFRLSNGHQQAKLVVNRIGRVTDTLISE